MRQSERCRVGVGSRRLFLQNVDIALETTRHFREMCIGHIAAVEELGGSKLQSSHTFLAAQPLIHPQCFRDGLGRPRIPTVWPCAGFSGGILSSLGFGQSFNMSRGLKQTTVISHVPGGPAADTSPMLPGWPWTSPNPNRMALFRLLRGILSSLGCGQSAKMYRCLEGSFKRHRQLKLNRRFWQVMAWSRGNCSSRIAEMI
jgi:hypothetical protein